MGNTDTRGTWNFTKAPTAPEPVSWEEYLDDLCTKEEALETLSDEAFLFSGLSVN
jgi:hypothetical protein